MEGIPAFFATTGVLLGTAGLYNSHHGRSSVGGIQQRLGGLCFLVATATQPVFAQATPTETDDNGEYWMGHYFPYSQYPHGHFDCAHGSTVYEQRRALDNERSRSSFFHEDNICLRGMSNLMKSLTDYFVVCHANGQMVHHPRNPDL